MLRHFAPGTPLGDFLLSFLFSVVIWFVLFIPAGDPIKHAVLKMLFG